VDREVPLPPCFVMVFPFCSVLLAVGGGGVFGGVRLRARVFWKVSVVRRDHPSLATSTLSQVGFVFLIGACASPSAAPDEPFALFVSPRLFFSYG